MKPRRCGGTAELLLGCIRGRFPPKHQEVMYSVYVDHSLEGIAAALSCSGWDRQITHFPGLDPLANAGFKRGPPACQSRDWEIMKLVQISRERSACCCGRFECREGELRRAYHECEGCRRYFREVK